MESDNAFVGEGCRRCESRGFGNQCRNIGGYEHEDGDRVAVEVMEDMRLDELRNAGDVASWSGKAFAMMAEGRQAQIEDRAEEVTLKMT